MLRPAQILLACSFAFGVAVPSASAQGTLASGLDSTLSLVQRWHAKWDSLVAPVARKQAVMSLQRLSLALDDLALAKIEFAEKVASVDWATQHSELSTEAKDLLLSVQAVRRRLRDFLRFVPNSYQATAGRIEDQLMEGLSQKVGSLTDIQRLVQARDPSVSAIRSEAEDAARKAREVKAVVDSLVTRIQGAPVR